MKIVYFDFVASGGVHTTFNSSMIEVLRKVFPKCNEIIFCSEKKHGQIVSKKCIGNIILKDEKFLWSKIMRFSKLRDLFSVFYIFKAIIKTSRDDILYVGLAFPFAINLMWLITKLTGRTIYVTLHGEMQQLLEMGHNTPQTKHTRYFKLMKFAFAHKNKSMIYIVLGKSIYEAVKFLFNSQNKVVVINHPAIFKEDKTKIKLHFPIRIGQIGSALERKGSDKLYEIAYLLKDEIAKGLVEFSVIGVCSLNIPQDKKSLVSCFTHFPSENELTSELQNLDFTVQLSTDKNCRAIASGTFMDSLIFNKPVIGLHSSYLDSYITEKNKELYELIGSDEYTLAEIIRNKLINLSQEDYETVICNLSEIRRSFTVEYNAKLFLEQIGD